jgi:hypothetical protein
MKELAAGITILAIGWGMTYDPPPPPDTSGGNFVATAKLDPSCCILIEDTNWVEDVVLDFKPLTN